MPHTEQNQGGDFVALIRQIESHNCDWSLSKVSDVYRAVVTAPGVIPETSRGMGATYFDALQEAWDRYISD